MAIQDFVFALLVFVCVCLLSITNIADPRAQDWIEDVATTPVDASGRREGVNQSRAGGMRV